MKIKILLFFFLTILLSDKINAQCTDCETIVIVPSSAPINVVRNNQKICITGNGNYTGTINYQGFGGVTICIAPTVTFNAAAIINNNVNGPATTFINYGKWIKSFSSGVTNKYMSFINYGTVVTPSFNFSGNNVFDNYGTFTVTPGGTAINVNADNIFITRPGSVTTIGVDLNVPTGATIEVGGIIYVKASLRVNSGGKIVGVPPNCAGIQVDGTFYNDGKIGIPQAISVNKRPTGNNTGPTDVQVTVNNQPPAIFNNPSDLKICAGGNAKFWVKASGNNLQYQWQIRFGTDNWINLTNGGFYSGVTTDTLRITGATLAMNNNAYRTLVTACPFPQYTSEAILTVSGVPIATKTSSTNFCYQGNVLLDTKATNLDVPKSKWYLLPDKTNAIATGASHTVGEAGIYVVNLTNTDQCVTIDTFKVTMFSHGLLELGKNQDTVCSNVLEPITVNGSWSKIEWTKTPNGVAIPNNPSPSSWNPAVSGLYEVTVTDNNNCKQIDAVNVTFNTAPTLELGKDTSLICFGTAKDIVIPNATTYHTIVWKSPSGVTIEDGTPSHSPKVNGIYQVTVGNTFKCFATDQVGVTYGKGKAIDLGASSRIVCFNVSNPIVVPGSPFNSVKWTTDNGVSVGDGTTNYDALKSGNYKVTATDLDNCTSTDDVTISFNDSLASFDIGPPNRVSCFNAPKDIIVNGIFKSIVWSAPEVIPVNKTKHFPKENGKYKVSVVNYSNCPAFDSIDITYEGDLPFNLEPSKSVCWSDDYLIVADKEIGGYNYKSIVWTTPANVNIPNNRKSWKPTTPGRYRIDVISKLGCPKSDSVQISFSPKINVGLNWKDTLSCGYQGNYLIKAPGGYTKYEWITPSPKGIIVKDSTFYPRSSGKHIVRVYNNTTCFTSDSVNVTYDGDSAEIGLPNQTVCGNDSTFVLKVTPNVFKTIVWTNDVGVTIPDGTPSFRPYKSGTYSIKATKSNGCYSIDTTNITYVDTLKVDLGKDSTISCEFKKTVLKPLKGNFNYIWSNNVGATISDGTPSYTPTIPGKYKVKVSNKTFPQCAGEDSIYVSIPPPIVLDFKGDSSVSCFGADFKLCGGTGYTKYDWSPAVPADVKECYSPTKDGRHKLTITDKYGCKKSDSTFVRYYEKFKLGLNNSDTAACYPYQEYKIKLPEGYAKYEWSPNISTTFSGKPVYSGLESQKFVIKVTNKDGCFDSDSVKVNFVKEIKFPNITGGDTTACGYAKYTIRPGPGFLRYDWVNNVAGINDSTHIPKSTGKYWVSVTTKRGGCKKMSDTMNVKFIPDRIVDLGGPVTVCSFSDTLTLNAGPGYEAYLWENNSNINKQTFHPTFPQNILNSKVDTFSVDVTYEKYCHAQGSRQVTFIRQDTLTLGPDTIVCPGYPISMSPGLGFDYYAWHFSLDPSATFSELPAITVSAVGTWTVDVTSICGVQSLNKLLENYEAPKLDLGKDTIICLGKLITLTNTLDVNNAYTYVWTEKDVDAKYESNIKILNNISENGDFYVMATDSNKCFSIDSIKVITKDDGYCFVLPNLITPNDDDYNEFFEIGGIRRNHWHLDIYNRWGDRVYQSKGYNNDWNGDGSGNGLYFYNLEDPDTHRRYKGWVEVIYKDGGKLHHTPKIP